MADTSSAADFYTRLEALRASSAAEHDPVGYAYLEALAHRATTQSTAIRQRLLAKLNLLADELAASVHTTPDLPVASSVEAPSPLAALLIHIGQQANAPLAPQPAGHSSTVNPENTPKSPRENRAPPPELKAASIFREDWCRLSTEMQLTRTLAQAPTNAGPMNSQHLVLRSLERMRDISPDYLQGFMSYIDTLIWLEHAAPTKPASVRATGGETEKKPRTPKRGVTKR